MKAPGCAAAPEKLKPDDGAGAGAATGAAALEPPKLKTEEGAAGVEVAPPPKVNGLAPVLAAAAGFDAADPKSKGDAAAVVTAGAGAAAPKENGEAAAAAA